MPRSARRFVGPLAAILVALAAGRLPAGDARAQPAAVTYAGPVVAGKLAAPPKNETSGLAASRRTPDLLWLHDDSGGKAMLYAVDSRGALRGTLQIGGRAKNEDWEDIAATELDGQAWLVIGDIGDNDAKRPHVLVHFVAEPSAERLALAGMLAERPGATLRLRYEDGARDCESLAIDARERCLYLLSKRDPTPRLYRVALPIPLAHGELTARLVGLVPHLPPPTFAQSMVKGHLGKHRAQPCAMDFAADGTAAVVLTYGDTLLFPRRPDESWADTLSREPVRLAIHDLPQAEAACFSADGRQIFVASESTRKLLRYDRR
jgi:hypothetical protein